MHDTGLDRQKQIVARDKGEHSCYKQKSGVLHGVEESIAQQRNNWGTGRLQRSFYRGTGFCRVIGSWGHDSIPLLGPESLRAIVCMDTVWTQCGQSVSIVAQLSKHV